jgi:hypothetical protein
VGGQHRAPAALPPRKTRYPLHRRLGELVWTCAKNLAPTGIRSPDRPARSQSLYRLSYRAHFIVITFTIFTVIVTSSYTDTVDFVNCNTLMPELNPSAQRCLPRFFYWEFSFLNGSLSDLLISRSACARTTPLDTTHPSTIFHRLLLN